MRNFKDDGQSTFDKFRSPQSVDIFPQGGTTQHFLAETETYNESEDRRLNETALWSTEHFNKERFNLQNGEGGSTFVAGRKMESVTEQHPHD